jgi:hypothetical protein
VVRAAGNDADGTRLRGLIGAANAVRSGWTAGPGSSSSPGGFLWPWSRNPGPITLDDGKPAWQMKSATDGPPGRVRTDPGTRSRRAPCAPLAVGVDAGPAG